MRCGRDGRPIYVGKELVRIEIPGDGVGDVHKRESGKDSLPSGSELFYPEWQSEFRKGSGLGRPKWTNL